jgi:guanylate kinase
MKSIKILAFRNYNQDIVSWENGFTIISQNQGNGKSISPNNLEVILTESPLIDRNHIEPLLIVISGPAGVGKDAVVRGLKDSDQTLHFVVTATSRAMRPGECEGVDYYFVTKERFEEMIRQNELAEYSWVYNDYKGVPRREIDDAIHCGRDVIMRVDVQGAAKLRELYPGAILIYLNTESDEELVLRLTSRNTESPEQLLLRIATAREELSHLPEFEYTIVNRAGQLHVTVETIFSIIAAEHHRVVQRKLT